MKNYEKPTVELIDLQIEEDIAADISGDTTSNPFNP